MRTRKTLLCRVKTGCYGDINAHRTLRVSAHCYRNGIVTHRIDTAKLLISGAPEEIRTPDPQIRSLVLYPAELRARFSLISGLGRPQPKSVRKVAKERFSYPL